MISTNLSTNRKMSSSQAGIESKIFNNSNFNLHDSSVAWQKKPNTLANDFLPLDNIASTVQKNGRTNIKDNGHEQKSKASVNQQIYLDQTEHLSSLTQDFTLEPAVRANSLLADIAICKRNIAFIESAFAEECANLRLQAEKRASKDIKSLEKLENSLENLVHEYKNELFGSKKTLNLSFGTLAFRESTRIVPIEGWSWEGVLACLENKGMHNMIRQKREVDKLALKNLPKSTLKNLGCESQVYESFNYQV